MRARLALALTTAAAVLTLTGCGTHETPAADTTPTPTVTDITTDTREVGQIVWKKWGEPVTADAVTMTVSAPEPLTPSETAHPIEARGKAASRVSVRIDNRRPVVLKSYDLSVTAATKNGVATAVADTANSVGFTGYAADLPPGQGQTVNVAFAVDPTTPGFAVTGEIDLLTGPTIVWSETGQE